MSELHTLVLVDDDGPTTVDPRSRRGRERARADPRGPTGGTRALVGLCVGAALFASGIMAYWEHRRANRLASELASRGNTVSVCATPGTGVTDHGTTRTATATHGSAQVRPSDGRRGLPGADAAQLEALAARHVVLGDYRSALDQYRVLAEGSPRPSVFTDLVDVLELELGCIESAESGAQTCD